MEVGLYSDVYDLVYFYLFLFIQDKILQHQNRYSDTL